MTEPPTMPPTPPPSPPPLAPPAADGGASPNRALMIVLAYLGPFAIIPLLVEKEDPEVQWHAKHGLVLFVAEIALMVGLAIVNAVIAAIPVINALACFGCVLYLIVLVPIVAVHVMAIIKGVNGERFIVPGLSQYADRF